MVQPNARTVTFFVFLTVFLDLVGFGIIIPLLPLYVKTMGGTPETVGFILAAFSFTQLIATPFLGRLSDRVGRRRVILLSLAGNAASMILFAVATKVTFLPLLFASRILAGATAGNLAACQAAIADVTSSQERAKGMGLVGAGIGLGMVLGPVLGGWASRYGTWAPPLGAAALAMIDLVGALVFMPETNPSHRARKSPAHESLWSAIKQRPIALVLALYFFTFLYMTTMQVAFPLLTSERLAWTQSDIGRGFGGFGLVMLVIQGGLIGKLAKTWRATHIVVGGSIMSMAGLIFIAIAHGWPILSCGLILLGAGLGVVNPCLSTIASEEAGADRQGAILGIAQSCGGLARTVGPVISGILYARIAPGAPFVGGSISALICTVLAVMLAARIRPRGKQGNTSDANAIVRGVD